MASVGGDCVATYNGKMTESLERIVFADESLSDDNKRHVEPFLRGHFDPQEYSREVLHNSSVSLAEHLSTIDSTISILDSSLKGRVVDDHEALTSNIVALDGLEASLIDLEAATSAILESTGHSLTSFRKLYDNYSARLVECERTKSALDLLRKVSKVTATAQTLRASLASDRLEFSKAAVAVHDLGGVCDDPELRNVVALNEDLPFVENIVRNLPVMLTHSLSEGLEKQDLSLIAEIVDASLLLKLSAQLLEELTQKLLDGFRTQIEEGLNIHLLAKSDAGKNTGKVPGRTTLPSVQTSPALRTAFWSRMDAIFSLICQNQIKIELLESVYIRRFDEYVLYVVDAPDVEEGRISEGFFVAALDILKASLMRCGKESSFLQQTLENEYPRLLKMTKECLGRLRNASLFLDFSLDNRSSATWLFRSAVESFQELFISRSLSRLLDPVNVGFADSNVCPSSDDVESLVRAITNEIVICPSDEILGILICNNVGKALRTTYIKLDEMVASGGEATQIIGGLTVKQNRNFQIVNISIYLKERLQQLLDTTSVALPVSGKTAIVDVLTTYEVPVKSVLGPLMNSILDSVEAILLTMHQEDFSLGEGEVDSNEMLDSPCSLYMRELQDFLHRIQQVFFAPLDSNKPIMRSFIVAFAQRCLKLFVRHISLIRPVGKQGRLKLATDCAQLEAALAPLNLHHSEYGNALQILKAMRPLLFQTPAQIAHSPYLGTVIPYSTVLHHLFSRAPVELQSPFQASGWSVSRYCRYLDEHPREMERLMIIKASLDNYANTVRSRGETHYAVIYPLMREMLGKALEITHSDS
ncbi:conserved oligomeric Golgi complex subunit 5-like [Paramacrobiotus metropolitanus]|uniref:conserved oligomeric Golgi complex subunit 5-like n=1 Tax=Paramacrobiotus metropolitanus TaxID=2943436 RepID=UPI0024463D8D|nr:conserved oligomeric Golgi complex subunit 5-like [Paramacrobiotus metropolitanus]